MGTRAVGFHMRSHWRSCGNWGLFLKHSLTNYLSAVLNAKLPIGAVWKWAVANPSSIWRFKHEHGAPRPRSASASVGFLRLPKMAQPSASPGRTGFHDPFAEHQ